jgi:membrane associated rhomboid family serine protease
MAAVPPHCRSNRLKEDRSKEDLKADRLDDALQVRSNTQEEPFAEPLPLPFVSLSMLTLIIVIFLAMLHVGQGDVTRVAHLFGDKENDLIRAGEWWRLITPLFLHGGWGHLIANGLTLLMLGIPMERIYGPRKFFLIYMLAGITGNLFSFCFSTVPSLGASGALYGLMGAGLVFPLRFKDRIDPRARKEILTQLGRAALINIGINFLPELHLDRMAHLGGILGGGLAALVWMPDVLEEEEPSRTYRAALWAAAAGMLIVTITAGWRQWQTARSVRVEVQAYYAPEAGDPWWGLLLPRTWQQVDTVETNGLKWTGARDAALKVIDSREHPQIVVETQDFLKSHNAHLAPFTVDGKRAGRAIVQDKATTAQVIQIETDERVIVLSFSCPTAVFADMQPTFDALVSKVRFVRPPRDASSAP